MNKKTSKPCCRCWTSRELLHSQWLETWGSSGRPSSGWAGWSWSSAQFALSRCFAGANCEARESYRLLQTNGFGVLLFTLSQTLSFNWHEWREKLEQEYDTDSKSDGLHRGKRTNEENKMHLETEEASGGVPAWKETLREGRKERGSWMKRRLTCCYCSSEVRSHRQIVQSQGETWLIDIKVWLLRLTAPSVTCQSSRLALSDYCPTCSGSRDQRVKIGGRLEALYCPHPASAETQSNGGLAKSALH